MFDIPENRLGAFLRSPFSSTLVATPPLAMFFFLFVGGWLMIAAGAGLIVFLLAGSRLSVRAEAEALVVQNRFLRHRIPWSEVRGIVSRDRPTMFTLIPTVSVLRRGSIWFSVSLYGTLGMSRQRRREVALALAEVGAEAGYHFPAGSDSELASE